MFSRLNRLFPFHRHFAILRKDIETVVALSLQSHGKVSTAKNALTTPFKDLGLDSLTQVEVIISAMFNLQALPEKDDLPSVASGMELVDFIEKSTQAREEKKNQKKTDDD